VAAKRVAADVCGCAYLAGKFPLPDILRLEQKVAVCAANNDMTCLTKNILERNKIEYNPR
jgi:hypothetical protein